MRRVTMITSLMIDTIGVPILNMLFVETDLVMIPSIVHVPQHSQMVQLVTKILRMKPRLTQTIVGNSSNVMEDVSHSRRVIWMKFMMIDTIGAPIPSMLIVETDLVITLIIVLNMLMVKLIADMN